MGSGDCSNQQVWEFNFFVFIKLQDLSDMLHYNTVAPAGRALLPSYENDKLAGQRLFVSGVTVLKILGRDFTAKGQEGEDICFCRLDSPEKAAECFFPKPPDNVTQQVFSLQPSSKMDGAEKGGLAWVS